jgi:urea ABC transporter urea binding protein
MAASRVGTKLGRHLITGVLGEGGMGVVYDAEDTLLQRKVAIKLLPEAVASDSHALRRFLQEAQSAARLSHSNVVGIFEIGAQDGVHFIVLERVAGQSTAELLKSHGPFHWAEATRIIADACRGLAAAHAAGLIHRDLKPANVMRSSDGAIKLTDFGLARLTDTVGESITAAGQVMGTPAYMSPEQCQGETVDARCDIYSLGATYFTLLTGQTPFGDATSAPKIMFAHCYQPVPDPREIDPVIPEQCASIVRRAMAKNPDDRYQTAEEMLADLETVLGASAVGLAAMMKPNPSGPGSPLRPSALQARQSSPVPVARPRRAWPWIAAAAFVVIAAAVGAVALSRRAGSDSGQVRSATPVGAVAPSAAAPVTTTPIRVGILHSLSGTMAQSETPVIDGALLAIDEINKQGGILGRPIEPVIADGMSDTPTFVAEAERLITSERVCTIFGCWTSADRKAVRPVVEKHENLLIYPVQYEGLEESPNIVYTGATPNQQIIPAIKWSFTDLGRRYFLVGSDYVFPRVANEIIRDQVAALGGEIVGERYLPLGSTEVADVIREITEIQPAVILNTINGDSNVAFFRALRAAGITPSKIPTITFSIPEHQLRVLGPRNMAGDFAAWNYFQGIDRPQNHEFISLFQAKYGPQRITSDPIEAAYFGVHLWAQAVAACGSDDPRAIRQAIKGEHYAAPEGDVQIDTENQHTWKTARIGQITDDGRIQVLWSSERALRPAPYPPFRTQAQWDTLLKNLYNRWGGHWANPDRASIVP